MHRVSDLLFLERSVPRFHNMSSCLGFVVMLVCRRHAWAPSIHCVHSKQTRKKCWLVIDSHFPPRHLSWYLIFKSSISLEAKDLQGLPATGIPSDKIKFILIFCLNSDANLSFCVHSLVQTVHWSKIKSLCAISGHWKYFCEGDFYRNVMFVWSVDSTGVGAGHFWECQRLPKFPRKTVIRQIFPCKVSVAFRSLHCNFPCSPFRLDHNRYGRGVLAYCVKCNTFCQRRLDLECAGTEILWLECRTWKNVFIFIICIIAFSITCNNGWNQYNWLYLPQH